MQDRKEDSAVHLLDRVGCGPNAITDFKNYFLYLERERRKMAEIIDRKVRVAHASCPVSTEHVGTKR